MRYYKLDAKAVVSEIFDDDYPAIFKNFPISKRMPPEEFAKLIPITDEDINVGVGMTKNEDGEWVQYVPPETEGTEIAVEVEAEPTVLDDIQNMLIDHEMRILEMELGLSDLE